MSVHKGKHEVGKLPPRIKVLIDYHNYVDSLPKDYYRKGLPHDSVYRFWEYYSPIR